MAAPLARLTTNAALLVCDVQSVFAKTISHWDSVVHVSAKMIAAADALGQHVVVTEQYPERLGKTVDALPLSDKHAVFAKKKFSMRSDAVDDALAAHRRARAERDEVVRVRGGSERQLMIVGIEAHVCVLQTVLDYIDDGYQVFVLTDGVSSSTAYYRSAAFAQMAQAGAVLTSSESALFMMLGGAEHPRFRDVSALIKKTNADKPDAGLTFTPGAV